MGLSPLPDRVQVVDALRLIEEERGIGVDHPEQLVPLHLPEHRLPVHLHEQRRLRAEIDLRHVILHRHGLLRRALGLGDGELRFEMGEREVGHLPWRTRAQGLQILVGLVGSGREVPLGDRDVLQGHEVLGPVDIGLGSEPDDAEVFLR